jgi:HAD superfamily hydrolase (TIGR01509 family)
VTATKVGLIIFDNDGVLVDSEPHAHPVLVALLQEYGWSGGLEASRREFLGVTVAHVRRVVEAQLGRSLPADFEERYHRSLFARYEVALRPIDGIRSVVESLQIPYCVASSGSRERVRRSLQLTGLWDLFEDRAFSADDVARGKPHPDLFLHAAEAMGTNAEECLVVEDSAAGLEAAARAGMHSIGFAARTPVSRLAAATLGIIDRMVDFGPLVDRYLVHPNRNPAQ